MIHISALERVGEQVQIDGRRESYAPANLMQVLQVVEETYRRTKEPPAGPDIRVVDWSGKEYDPALPHDQESVQNATANARRRIR